MYYSNYTGHEMPDQITSFTKTKRSCCVLIYSEYRYIIYYMCTIASVRDCMC